MTLPGSLTRRQIVAQSRIRAPAVLINQRSAGLDHEIVVSLTTYPPRIGIVGQAIRSILRQSVRPDRVVLNLFTGDFPERRLPHRLTRLTSDGLEIHWCDINERSHMKLLPALRRFPSAAVITVDDDTLYPPRLLEHLLIAHCRDSNAVWTARGREIGYSEDGRLAPYNSWRLASPATACDLVFPTGVGGVLYPSGALSPIALDTELALALCPTADDVWFKAMSSLASTSSRVINYPHPAPLMVWGSQTTQLMATNVDNKANDAQLARTSEYFALWKPSVGTRR